MQSLLFKILIVAAAYCVSVDSDLWHVFLRKWNYKPREAFLHFHPFAFLLIPFLLLKVHDSFRGETVKLGKFIRPPHITYHAKVKHSAMILLHLPANWLSPSVSEGALMTDTSGPLCYAAAYLELSGSGTTKISVISWGWHNQEFMIGSKLYSFIFYFFSCLRSIWEVWEQRIKLIGISCMLFLPLVVNQREIASSSCFWSICKTLAIEKLRAVNFVTGNPFKVFFHD